ncbi:MAG: TetR/AcrR family transcriptional regulator [Holdemanella sp.]|nr:TetR/AcrR family transcriptional regulator [Holdemanella sp.]
MAPRTKVSRDQIVNEAFQLVYEKGLQFLTVRNLAQRLGCSTQPIMYNFHSVEQIREALIEVCIMHFKTCIQAEIKKEMAFNYIRYSHDYKNIFTFLCASKVNFGLDFDQNYMYMIHGYACMVSTSMIEFDEKACIGWIESV